MGWAWCLAEIHLNHPETNLSYDKRNFSFYSWLLLLLQLRGKALEGPFPCSPRGKGGCNGPTRYIDNIVARKLRRLGRLLAFILAICHSESRVWGRVTFDGAYIWKYFLRGRNKLLLAHPRELRTRVTSLIPCYIFRQEGNDATVLAGPPANGSRLPAPITLHYTERSLLSSNFTQKLQLTACFLLGGQDKFNNE